MNREYVKVDGYKILMSLFQKYKDEPWVLSGSEVASKVNHLVWRGRYGQLWGSDFEFGLKGGIVLKNFGGGELIFLHSLSDSYNILVDDIDLYDLKFLKIINTTLITIDPSFSPTNKTMRLSKPEVNFLQEFIDTVTFEVDRKIKLYESDKEKQLKELKHSQKIILNELDKDGNGIVDILEGDDDFIKLFRKHQSLIKDFDKDYINHLVKISNFLKTKRSNIQKIFSEIKKTNNKSQLEENSGLLKNQIHTYEVVLFHSLSMITAIVEDDLITVNEIYEQFDKLKIFKTDHENEVSLKLSDIGDKLSSLMYSINSMEMNIVNGLNQLSYLTQSGFSDLSNSLSRELQSINSSIDTNNLLTGISAYQLYKINKKTKGLIE